MKAVIITYTDPVGDSHNFIHAWEDWQDPLIIQVHNTVLVIKDHKVQVRVENVTRYEIVDNYDTPEKAGDPA